MNRAVRHVIRFMLVLPLAYLAPGQVSISGAAGEALPQDMLGGRTLMTFCGGKTDTDAGVCNGYILGVAEAMLAGQTVYGTRSCNHDGIKAQQLVDLVRMDLSENPDLQKQKAGPMVAGILAKEFPCYNDYTPAAGGNGITAEPLPAQ